VDYHRSAPQLKQNNNLLLTSPLKLQMDGESLVTTGSAFLIDRMTINPIAHN
jgi:hypothetical protein